MSTQLNPDQQNTMRSKPTLFILINEPTQQPIKAIHSCRHLISSFVIIDLIGIDETQLRKAHKIEKLPGVVVKNHSWQNLAHAIELARTLAQEYSDTLIWLKPSETIAELSPDAVHEIACESSDHAKQVLIEKGQTAFAENRIFSTESSATLFGDQHIVILDEPGSEVTTNVAAPRLRILSDKDQPHAHDAASLSAELELHNSPLPDLWLALAQTYLSGSNLNDASHALARLSALDPSLLNENQSWLAAYLQGVVNQAMSNSAEAIHHYQNAINVHSDRPEPYARLIEILLEHEDALRAAQIAEIAETMDYITGCNYLEPKLYHRDMLALCLRAYVANRQEADAVRLYSKVSSQLSKTPTMEQALAERRAQHAAPPDIQPASAQSTAQTNAHASEKVAEIETKSTPKLTIGMATFDDFDGVYFTVMSLILYHRDCLDEIEILIVDNNPDSDHGTAVKNLANGVDIRYITAKEFKGTTVRERVFLEAQGDFVMCVDCHVFLHEGVVRHLLNYIDQHPNSKDIWHGPMVSEGKQTFATHMEERWQHGFYGVFEKDARGRDKNGAPFEIPMQGLAMFVCKRSEWAGFNRKFRGFGGEEGYIHYKFALNGGKTFCLPFLRWTHRFPRPNGVKYENRWEQRIRNYLIGWSEIGRDTQSIYDHYSQQMGAGIMAMVHAELAAERASPFWAFDSIYFVCKESSEWEQTEAFRHDWGLAQTSQRIDVKKIDDLNDRDAQIIEIEKALEHGFSIAQKQSLPNVIFALNSSIDESQAAIDPTEWLNTVQECCDECSSVFLPQYGIQLVFVPASEYNAGLDYWQKLQS